MRNLFCSKPTDSIRRLAGSAVQHRSTGDVAWMFVGGAILLAVLVLTVREIPAMVREARIMRM
ncbi:MAG TPA: hypothetical protein VGK91_07115 [Candidatus Udaeobacter sp.]